MAKKLKSLDISHPNSLELTHLGFVVIKDFPDGYTRYLAVLEGYKDVGLISEEAVYGITNMVERNRREAAEEGYKGIGAMTVNPKTRTISLEKITTQPQLQPQP
jgi:hypothetical protein